MFSFALFGTGWRAQFYMRIAKALPERFTLASVYTHSSDRAADGKLTYTIQDGIEDAVIGNLL